MSTTGPMPGEPVQGFLFPPAVHRLHP